MGLIVASPTAGSAGIVPGLMLAMQEHYQFSDEEIIRALFNASAIGYLAMRNATVADAAIADATPTSAWHPPTAPATVAFRIAR